MPAAPHERLGSADAAWLHMDHDANHMVITIVLMFERPIPYGRMRRLVEDRLLKLPRFRQRIVASSWPFTVPCWEDDPGFDLDRHFSLAEVDGPCDEASLARVVSEAMSDALDPAHPLWRFAFVPEYRDGCALVTRIHHCIGDGFGLIVAFLSMCDDPGAVRTSIAPAACAAPATSGAVSATFAVADGLVTTAKLLLMPFDGATSLKGPLAVRKQATWSSPVPLHAVKAAGRAMGASVNDVLLTGVAGALRRYLALQAPVDGDTLVRGIVPVNLRRNGDTEAFGNRFGLVFMPMPVGIADPAERLFEIRRHTRAFKQSPEPVVTFQILRALGLAPGPLFDIVIGLFDRKASAVITNVIGPREPLTYAGVRLSQAMFWVPCAGRLGLGISLLSYAGQVSVGFASDEQVVASPAALVDAFDAELAQLFDYATVPA